MLTQIEAEWLWAFLQRKLDNEPVLFRAQAVAAMSVDDKKRLRDWVYEVGKLPSQFQPNPPAWQYLPQVAHCRHFINADLIAAGLSPLAPELQLLAAT